MLLYQLVLKIKNLKDDEGSAVIYDDTNKPGDRIVRKVSGVGNVRIEVYLNGALVQETAL